MISIPAHFMTMMQLSRLKRTIQQAIGRLFVSYVTVIFGWVYISDCDRFQRDYVSVNTVLSLKNLLRHAALNLNH